MVAAWNTHHPDTRSTPSVNACAKSLANPWDFIQAPAPAPTAKPQWKTVTDYPLRPRVLWAKWQDPDQLIGVRFNSQTRYGLLDIDAGESLLQRRSDRPSSAPPSKPSASYPHPANPLQP
jgi:hypothetical protein